MIQSARFYLPCSLVQSLINAFGPQRQNMTEVSFLPYPRESIMSILTLHQEFIACHHPDPDLAPAQTVLGAGIRQVVEQGIHPVEEETGNLEEDRPVEGKGD